MRRSSFSWFLAAGALAACAGDGPPVEPALSGDPAAFRWALPAGWAPPPVPADNPMSDAKVALGRRLFYDTRLSGNGGFACSSCHRQEFGFADARNIPVGSTGEPHPRNSQGIAGSGYLRVLTWADPGAAALEAQALVPMFGEHPVELGLKGMESVLLDRLRAVPEYRTLFPVAFPGVADPFTVGRVTQALAAFQRTIIPVNAPYDRQQRGEAGAMSAAALRGEALFRSPRLRCEECHRGPSFTAAAGPAADGLGALPYANTGLYDVGGTGAYPAGNQGLVEHTGRAVDMGRFRIPSLRHLAFTFPYMHDGSLSTLEDVVDHYARGGRLVATGPLAGDGSRSRYKDPRVSGFALSAAERADLVAFLRSLSDSSLVRDPRFANPWVVR